MVDTYIGTPPPPAWWVTATIAMTFFLYALPGIAKAVVILFVLIDKYFHTSIIKGSESNGDYMANLVDLHLADKINREMREKPWLKR